MAFVDYLRNAISGGEQALGINTPGHGAVYNAVKQVVNPTPPTNYRTSALSPQPSVPQLVRMTTPPPQQPIQINQPRMSIAERFAPQLERGAQAITDFVGGTPLAQSLGAAVGTRPQSDLRPMPEVLRSAGSTALNIGQFAIPGVKIPAAIEAASPLTRLVGSSAIRGTEAAALGGLSNYLQSGNAKEALKSLPLNFAVGAGVNALLSPKLTGQAIKQLATGSYDKAATEVPKPQIMSGAPSGPSEVLYRGGKPFNVNQLEDRGLPLTTDKSVAETFANGKNAFDSSPAGKIMGKEPNSNIIESYKLSPNAQIATKQDIPSDIFNAYKNSDPMLNPSKGEALLGRWAKDNGYDAIDYRTLGNTSFKESEIKVLNPNVLIRNEGLGLTGTSQEAPKPQIMSGAPSGPKVEPVTPADLKIGIKNGLYDVSAINTQLEQRSGILQNLLNKVEKTPVDTQLIRTAIEHPEATAQLATQSSNPKLFSQAVDTFRQFTDFTHQLATSKGVDLNYVENYYPHIFDLSNPETAARYQDLLNQRGMLSNFKGSFTQPRVFNDLQEAAQFGFSPKNPRVLQDIQQYTNAAKLRTGNDALLNAIEKSAPDQLVRDINATGIPRDAQGRPFRQLSIPGLEGTAVSPNVYNQIKHLEPSALANNKGIQALDKAGAILKQTQLGLGGFHAVKTTARDIVPMLANGELPRIDLATQNMLSQSARDAFKQSMVNNGTLDLAAHIGVTLSNGSDIMPAVDSLANASKKINILKNFNDAVFSGMIDTYKLTLVQAMKDKLDTSTPAGLAEARQVGQQINDLFGGLNRIAGDTYLKDPTVRQLARLTTLAPDFTEGKIRTTLAALTKGGTSGNLARVGLLGEALVVGVTAELARRVITGKFSPDLKTAMINDVLDPNFPVPSSFNPAGDTRQRVIGLPGSNITDVYRAATDPTHFLNARGSSLISLFNKAISNQDYYGRQLYNPTDTLAQKTGALLQSELPIPVTNALAVANGKASVPAAIMNTLGGRVHIAANDPSVVMAQQRQQYAQTLPANLAQIYQALHPASTDAAGNALPKEGSLTSQQNALVYLNHPEFLAADTHIAQQAGGLQDPFWSLTPDQQKLVLLQRSQGVVKSSDLKPLYNAPWYQQFKQDQNTFYNSLPTTGSTSTTSQSGSSSLTPAQAATQSKRLALGLNATPPSNAKAPTSLKGPTIKTTSVKGATTVKGTGGRKAKVIKAKTPKLYKPAKVKPFSTPTISLKLARSSKAAVPKVKLAKERQSKVRVGSAKLPTYKALKMRKV